MNDVKFISLIYHRIEHLQGERGKEREIYWGNNDEGKEVWILLSFNLSFIDFDFFIIKLTFWLTIRIKVTNEVNSGKCN